jgi:hypothetical protein
VTQFTMIQEVRKIFLRLPTGGKEGAQAGTAPHKHKAGARGGTRSEAEASRARARVEHDGTGTRNSSLPSPPTCSGREEEIAAIKELFAAPELVLPHLLTGAKIQP